MIYKPHPHLPEQPLKIAKGCVIHDTAKLDRCGEITLELWVCICEDVLILRHIHKLNLDIREYHYSIGTPESAVWAAKPLIIGHHSWVGARSTILPQVNFIAPGTILGVGTVLSKDVTEPGLIYAGNPARIIGINTDFGSILR